MFDEAEDVRPWLTDPPSVTAVLVAHNGMSWLPKVLSSLGAMEFAPTAWHAVDVSSTDGSGQLLREAFGPERLTYAPSGTGFGAAVRLALAEAPQSDWIWLLHDDSAVCDDTLAALLDEATSADDIAIVGPKIREWPSLQRILEVGITVAGTGARVTGLEPGEPDAGQHDRPRDVLAVNTAGMLIRRDAWCDLGGFDTFLRLYCDDLDLCWRAKRAGYRVRVAPMAVIFHAEASARGNRPVSAGDVHGSEARRAAMFTLLANTSLRSLPWLYVRLFFGSLLRFLGFLLAKAPEDAADELYAMRAVYARPDRLHVARVSRSAAARSDARSVRPLLPSPWLPYQHGFDSAREAFDAVLRPETVESGGRRTSIRRASAFDAEAIEGTSSQEPSFLVRRPWLVTAGLLGLLAVVASRGLFGEGYLSGGALLAAPDAASNWWTLFFERWHDVGLGSDATAPPYALLLAVFAIPVWFNPGLLIALLILGAVPLAALTAHRFARRWCANRYARIGWAATYGLLVVGSGAVSQGRIGTVVAAIVAPIAMGAAIDMVGNPGWQGGLRTGLWIALAAAFAPIVFLCALVLLVGLAITGKRQSMAPLVLALAVPAVLLGPWLWSRVVHPSRFWWEAGWADAGIGDTATTVLDVALGRPAGPGTAPAWLHIALVLLGLLALASRRRTAEVLWCWAVALVGVAVVVVGHTQQFSLPGGSTDIAVWTGVGAIAWLGGLAAASVVIADDWVTSGHVRSVSRSTVVGLVALALLAPVGTGVWWVVRGQAEPLVRDKLTAVPAYLAERADQVTLVVDGSIDSGVGYSVVVEEGPRLGQEAILPEASEARQLTETVQSLLSNPSEADLEALASRGISAIYAPADVDDELARRLDTAPGLAPSGSNDPNARVWLVKAESDVAEPQGSYLRWLVASAHVLAILVAVALTAPVRQRRRQW